MRVARFEAFALDLIKNSNTPAVKGVSTFRDVGFTKAPYGLIVEFTSGATAYLNSVMMLAPGTKHDQDEQIIEGDTPIAPLPFPEGLGAGGKIKLTDVESWFVALLAASGSREISSIDAWLQRKDARPDHAGVTLTFHSGGKVFTAVAHLLRPGAQPNSQEWHTPAQEV